MCFHSIFTIIKEWRLYAFRGAPHGVEAEPPTMPYIYIQPFLSSFLISSLFHRSPHNLSEKPPRRHTVASPPSLG